MTNWIPMSECTPEFGQYVLITCYGEVYIARYTGNSWIVDGHEDVAKDDVDAWMVLPMPYKPVCSPFMSAMKELFEKER